VRVSVIIFIREALEVGVPEFGSLLLRMVLLWLFQVVLLFWIVDLKAALFLKGRGFRDRHLIF
jgi:hypothetical protein